MLFSMCVLMQVTMESDASECHADGTTGKYYALSKVADEHGDVFYNGILDCLDSECSEDCITVSLWQEGSCQRDSTTGHGIQIASTLDTLQTCASAFPYETKVAGEEDNSAQIVHIAGTDNSKTNNNADAGGMVHIEAINTDVVEKEEAPPPVPMSNDRSTIIPQSNTTQQTKSIISTTVPGVVANTTDKSNTLSGVTAPAGKSTILSGVTAPASSKQNAVPQMHTLKNAVTATHHDDTLTIANMVGPVMTKSGDKAGGKMKTVMIAAGCVMGVALVTIGLIYRQKIARNYDSVSQESDDDDDDDFYTEYDYECYKQYDQLADRYEDERLITVI